MEERNWLLTVEFQLRHVKGMTLKKKNHHFSNTTTITVSCKMYQWMLELIDGRMLRNKKFTRFQSVSLKNAYQLQREG